MRYAVVDLETTGLCPERDRIVEIAIVLVDGAGSIVAEYETLVNPDRSPGPSEIHCIHAFQLVMAPHFYQVAGDVCDFLRDNLVVGYQVSFDASFLVEEFRRSRMGTPVFSTFCLKEELGAFLEGPRDLKSACRSMGVIHKPRHEALADARAAAGLLEHALHQRDGFKKRIERAYRQSLWPPVQASGLRHTRRDNSEQRPCKSRRAPARSVKRSSGQVSPGSTSQPWDVAEALKKAEELVRMVHILSTPPLRSVTDLAPMVGRSERTVYRYLRSLGEMGLPIVEEHSRYGLLNSAYLPPLDLDLRETLALYFSIAIAEGRLDGLSTALTSAFGKLRRRLGHGDAIGDLAEHVLAPVSAPGPGSGLEMLSAAIVERREVSFLHRPLSGDEKVRHVRPLSLFLFEEAWYVWTFDLDRNTHRRFRLSRLRDIRVLDTRFVLGSPGEPMYHRWDHGEGTPIQVTLRVTESLAMWLKENRPHPSVQLSRGTCSLQVRDPAAMVPYLLSLQGVQVLEPPWLVECLRARALEIARAHGMERRPAQTLDPAEVSGEVVK